jgi:haloacetate dehalogenase
VFEGFKLRLIDTGEAVIRVRYGGKGPPLLLLHGHPQTHAMWHKIAPRLAQDFTVVAADLRGYGDSSKPPTTPDHEPYSKRAMGRDQLEVMRQLGFERFFVAGHDRGGRCAYRMALDYPEQVLKLAVLDIIPTGEHFRLTNMAFALGYWHWFFLAQPFDLPERMIGADPAHFYFHYRASGGLSTADKPGYFSPEALEDYLRCVRNPATIHAMCEDYRAGATFDFRLDEADRGKKRISCPTLALWAARGKLGDWYDVLAVWRDWAGQVEGRALDCGHHMAEEAPDETYTALYNFFSPG